MKLQVRITIASEEGEVLESFIAMPFKAIAETPAQLATLIRDKIEMNFECPGEDDED